MKKFILSLILSFFLSVSLNLNAFSIPDFPAGKAKILIYNISLLGYYDNGTSESFNAPVLGFNVKIFSDDFDNGATHIYLKINDNQTFDFSEFTCLTNVAPSYKNTYVYSAKIVPPYLGENGFSSENYENMLDKIDNITFYITYKNQTYSYTFNNFNTKYASFLKTFYTPVTAIDTSNYPVVSWTGDNEGGYYGFSLYTGDDEKWDNSEYADYISNKKIDYDIPASFAGWDNLTSNQVDFSQYSNVIIPKDLLVFKMKYLYKYSNNEDEEGSSVLRLFAGYKKIPEDKVVPIVTFSGWKLLGTEEEMYMSNLEQAFGANNVSTIWVWRNGGWQIYSPDSTILSIIKNYGLKVLYSVFPNEGLWIKFK